MKTRHQAFVEWTAWMARMPDLTEVEGVDQAELDELTQAIDSLLVDVDGLLS